MFSTFVMKNLLSFSYIFFESCTLYVMQSYHEYILYVCKKKRDVSIHLYPDFSMVF